MYRIVLKKDVDKFLKKHQDLIPRFMVAANKLAHNPFDDSLDIKPMSGTDSNTEWRLRIGKYRFIYEVWEEEVFIFFITAGSRGDVYK